MRTYLTDLKERLVRAVAEGQPMREAAEAITPADALAWFAYAGYALPAQSK